MGVIENIKEIADLAKQLGDIDLNRKMLILEGEVHDLKRTNMRLETELEETRKLLKRRQELKYREPFYYEDSNPIPYCSACWKAKDIDIPLHFVFDRTDATRWDCPNCKHVYIVKKDRTSHDPQPPPVINTSMGWMGR
jgi:hypothetical protein